MRRMLTIDDTHGWFSCRAVGVAVVDGYALLYRARNDDFWLLPGGRVEMHESSADALLREMEEEMGVTVSLERLLWVNEQFFTNDQGRRIHGIGFFYLMTVPQSIRPQRMMEFTGKEEDIDLIFRWFPVRELERLTLPLYPVFLRTALSNLPDQLTHLIIQED